MNQIDLPCLLEVERCDLLFVLIITETCESTAVYQGPQKESDDCSNFNIEDSVATFHTLQQIIAIVEKLRESHEKYQKTRSSSAKYGSE